MQIDVVMIVIEITKIALINSVVLVGSWFVLYSRRAGIGERLSWVTGERLGWLKMGKQTLCVRICNSRIVWIG